MEDQIKTAARELGFDLVGICGVDTPESVAFAEEWVRQGLHGTMHFMARSLALRADVNQVLPGAKSALVVGLNYFQPNDPTPGMPRIAKYALGRDYHRVIRTKLSALGKKIEALVPESTCRACVDSAPMFEREFAVRAGLGWLGKNSCLINTKRGSWFFLGVLLTTAELIANSPGEGGCGTCRACIDACPTGAIVQLDGRWTVDSRRCISYLTIEHRGDIEPELVEKMGDWTFGCDICQDVCPFNHARTHQPERSAVTQESDFLDERVWPSLADLVTLSDVDWDTMTRGSATRRANVEQWRRNAAISRRNAGLDTDDDR